MADYVYLLLSILQKHSISQIVGCLKEKGAMMIFERHTNLKYKYENKHFWVIKYYVTTIQKYIREQEKQYEIEDKLNTKLKAADNQSIEI